MKVNFSLNNAPVSNAYSAVNFSVPIKAQIPNFKSESDVFVKSSPVFRGNPDDEIRKDVIANGIDGIVSCLMLYANPCASAYGHKMPTHDDFDFCMKNFFPLSCAASSTYAVPEGGHVKYPNQDEFVEIMKGLWTQSNGPDGADLDKYNTPKILNLSENGRKYYIYDFIKDDMARAMNEYSKTKYDTPINNLDDVRDFALKMYDEPISTIKRQVTKRTIHKAEAGKISKDVKLLLKQPDSMSMINYLLEHKSRFFDYPMSIRERYEDSKPRQPEPFFTDGDPYFDHRTDAEKAIDQMNGWPW